MDHFNSIILDVLCVPTCECGILLNHWSVNHT